MRWKDSLGVVRKTAPEEHMRWAVYQLGVAVRSSDTNAGALALAGARIRAAREGLGEKSQRVQYVGPPVDPDLLTMALRYVTLALDCGAEGGSYWLRHAEACLRTMWKRGQARG